MAGALRTTAMYLQGTIKASVICVIARFLVGTRDTPVGSRWNPREIVGLHREFMNRPTGTQGIPWAIPMVHAGSHRRTTGPDGMPLGPAATPSRFPAGYHVCSRGAFYAFPRHVLRHTDDVIKRWRFPRV